MARHKKQKKQQTKNSNRQKILTVPRPLSMASITSKIIIKVLLGAIHTQNFMRRCRFSGGSMKGGSFRGRMTSRQMKQLLTSSGFIKPTTPANGDDEARISPITDVYVGFVAGKSKPLNLGTRRNRHR